MWMRGELFGGLAMSAKIVFLGNTIRQDGLCPRIRKDYKDNKNWDIYFQPVYDADRNIVWKRITKEYLAKVKEEQGTIAFNQNFELIPYADGDRIVTSDMIRWTTELKFDRYAIGIDPAISEKSQSDPFGICVTGFRGNERYVVEVLELIGKDKSPARSVEIVKRLYKKWKDFGTVTVIVETVAFQQVYASLLKAQHLPTLEVKPSRDKVTRLMEWQAEFENGRVFFHESCSRLVDQLLMMPASEHDDMVDAMMYSF